MKRFAVTIFAFSAMLFASSAAAQGKNKITCGSDVPLVVAVSGTRTAPGGYQLTSDGLGEYRDGTKGAAKVTAHFQVDNCTHDFTTNLASSTRAMWALLSTADQRAWFFNFDRVHSVPVTPQTQSESEIFVASHAFCTGGVQRNAAGQIQKNAEGWYFDNYAGCGIDEFGRAFIRRAGGISLDPDDRLQFQASPIDHPNGPCVVNPSDPGCEMSALRVYHPDPNTWVVRSELPASGAHRVWQGGDGYVFVGYETVPFEITAVRK
jgi:hypothetical protein